MLNLSIISFLSVHSIISTLMFTIFFYSLFEFVSNKFQLSNNIYIKYIQIFSLLFFFILMIDLYFIVMNKSFITFNISDGNFPSGSYPLWDIVKKGVESLNQLGLGDGMVIAAGIRAGTEIAVWTAAVAIKKGSEALDRVVKNKTLNSSNNSGDGLSSNSGSSLSSSGVDIKNSSSNGSNSDTSDKSLINDKSLDDLNIEFDGSELIDFIDISDIAYANIMPTEFLYNLISNLFFNNNQVEVYISSILVLCILSLYLTLILGLSLLARIIVNNKFSLLNINSSDSIYLKKIKKILEFLLIRFNKFNVIYIIIIMLLIIFFNGFIIYMLYSLLSNLDSFCFYYIEYIKK